MGVENYLIQLVAGSGAGAAVGPAHLRSLQGAGRDAHRAGWRNSAMLPGARLRKLLLGSGYTGRVGIFELMELTDEIRKQIMKGEDAVSITAVARRNGMRNLREDGWLKISQGMTTADEVMRVTQEF